jgi:hypothetical protein
VFEPVTSAVKVDTLELEDQRPAFATDADDVAG